MTVHIKPHCISVGFEPKTIMPMGWIRIKYAIRFAITAGYRVGLPQVCLCTYAVLRASGYCTSCTSLKHFIFFSIYAEKTYPQMRANILTEHVILHPTIILYDHPVVQYLTTQLTRNGKAAVSTQM